MSRKIEITIVPKELGQLIDQLIDDILNHLTPKSPNPQGKSLMDLIPHHYYPSYNLYQGQCYQQYTPNACGYHATFNTLCFMNYFAKHSETVYDILSRGSFWRFKVKVQNFLREFKEVNKLKDQWPWRSKDIIEGDFERTYNQVCVKQLDDFGIFRSHPDFQFISGTWQFQFKNLICDVRTKKQMQDKFNYFLNYKGNKPLVLNLMLAITTHWTCFFAIKYQNKTQFWFFDSFNNLTLDYSLEEIKQFINEKNQQRKKYKKPEMTTFQKQTYVMCQLDIQISLRLIIQCLNGKNTLDNYVYNQMFNIFADPIQQAINNNGNHLQNTLRGYKHNIRSFYTAHAVQWDYLTERNRQRMRQFVQVSQSIRQMHEQGRQFYSYLKKYIS